MRQALSVEGRDGDPEADVSEVSSPASLLAIPLLSPQAMEVAGHIIKFEEQKREKAKVRCEDDSLSHEVNLKAFCLKMHELDSSW